MGADIRELKEGQSGIRHMLTANARRCAPS
jgi:hypothetical protein